jgi:hypothetical protein
VIPNENRNRGSRNSKNEEPGTGARGTARGGIRNRNPTREQQEVIPNEEPEPRLENNKRWDRLRNRNRGSRNSRGVPNEPDSRGSRNSKRWDKLKGLKVPQLENRRWDSTKGTAAQEQQARQEKELLSKRTKDEKLNKWKGTSEISGGRKGT